MFDSVIAAGSVVLADGSTVVTNVLNTLSTWVIIGGGLWGVFGGVTLAGGLKDHAGPQIQSGVWQLVGAGDHHRRRRPVQRAGFVSGFARTGPRVGR